jgi:ligand-binding sensor domain-containing protein
MQGIAYIFNQGAQIMKRAIPAFIYIICLIGGSFSTPIIHTTPFGEWELYDSSNSQLPGNDLRSIAADSTDRIWTGTWSKGVVMFNGSEWKIYNSTNSAIPNDTIQDIAVDKLNTIWIATQNGIAKFDGAAWHAYTQANAPLPVRHTRAIACDTNINVWIGCGNVDTGGLLRFDGVTWTQYSTGNSILPCRAVNTIVVDKNNDLWVGTTQFQGNGGLVRFDGNVWTEYDKLNSIMPYNCVDCLCPDSKGNIWVGTSAIFYYSTESLEGALLKVNIAGNNWKVCNPSESGHASNRITTVTVDTNGYTWVATSVDVVQTSTYIIFFDYTISVYDGSKWIAISEIDTLLRHTYCPQSVVDKHNNIWFATDRGLLKISPQNLETLFTAKINRPAFIKRIQQYDPNFYMLYDVKGRKIGRFTADQLRSEHLGKGVYIQKAITSNKGEYYRKYLVVPK